MTEKTGAVWGVNIDVIPNVSKDKRFVKLQSLVARQCFSLRGGMHDTLIRREAVAGIRIPEELHAYEESFIVKTADDKKIRIKPIVVARGNARGGVVTSMRHALRADIEKTVAKLI